MLDIYLGRVKLKLDYDGGVATQDDLRKLPEPSSKGFFPAKWGFDTETVFHAFCGDKPSEPKEVPILINATSKWYLLDESVDLLPSPLPGESLEDREKASRAVEERVLKTLIKKSGLSKKKFKQTVDNLIPPLPIPFPASTVNTLLGKFEFKVNLHIRWFDFRGPVTQTKYNVSAVLRVPYMYYFSFEFVKACDSQRKPRIATEIVYFPLPRGIKILEETALEIERARQKQAKKFLKELEESEGR